MRLVVETERQSLHRRVEVGAQIVGDAMGQPFAEVALAERSNGAHHGDAQDEQRRVDEHHGVARSQAPVDGRLDDLWHEQVEQRRADHGRVADGHL